MVIKEKKCGGGNFIFKVCIDNLPKLLYNEKRILCIFGILLVLSQIWTAPAAADAPPTPGAVLTAACTLSEDGSLAVLLRAEEPVTLCGFLLKVSFDRKGLSLLDVSPGAYMEGLTLTAVPTEDGLLLLCDGEENITCCGTLLQLVLAPAEGDLPADAVLSFSFFEAYRFEGERPLSIRLLCADLTVPGPTALAVSVTTRREGTTLCILPTVSCRAGLFARLSVTLVDLNAQAVSRLALYAVRGGRDQVPLAPLSLPQAGQYCLILETAEGETFHRLVLYLDDGTLYR